MAAALCCRSVRFIPAIVAAFPLPCQQRNSTCCSHQLCSAPVCRLSVEFAHMRLNRNVRPGTLQVWVAGMKFFRALRHLIRDRCCSSHLRPPCHYHRSRLTKDMDTKRWGCGCVPPAVHEFVYSPYSSHLCSSTINEKFNSCDVTSLF